jgi:hypothetical protein
MPTETDAPQAADAAMNTPNPASSTRRDPVRSPSAPALRISAANVSV